MSDEPRARHILIVEDDRDLAEITRIHLEGAGYSVCHALDCVGARAHIDNQYFDLVLLDIMLPDGSGHELCEYLREKDDCPVIFTSCLEDSGTIVASLTKGGDDYVTKPVHYGELLARIEANIRRFRESRPAAGAGAKGVRRFAGFLIDTVRRRVVIDTEEICLTQIEYAILDYLSARPGELILYDDLYCDVWGSDSFGDVRTLLVHVSNLRKKIDPESRGVIENVRGVGYLFGDV
ncbi:MAG: response regulator transcription factor [Clostridiales Family XIII bacterium]|jgi:DNA-binding response OmpR family regulator|nr:response regulator transcription factor [Clostridiales Family XIII bacterium]